METKQIGMGNVGRRDRLGALVAVKAVLLGRKLAASIETRARLDNAIELLHEDTTHEAWMRELFYRLLLCEVMRSHSNVVSLRRSVKAMSGTTGIYELYMMARSPLDGRKRLRGFHRYVIVENPQAGLDVAEVVLGAVDLCNADLSQTEARFVYDASLEEMLEKHCPDLQTKGARI